MCVCVCVCVCVCIYTYIFFIVLFLWQIDTYLLELSQTSMTELLTKTAKSC